MRLSLPGLVADAEDAPQETLTATWQGLPGFQGRASIRTWLPVMPAGACVMISARRGQ